MKFNVEGAFMGLSVWLVFYLIASIGFIFIDGLDSLISIFPYYVKLGIFMGIVGFIFGGILSGYLFGSFLEVENEK